MVNETSHDFKKIVRMQSDLGKQPYINSTKSLTIYSLIEFKHLGAKTCEIIKEAKKEYWEKYVNSFNTHSKTQTIWEMIKNISEKNQTASIKHLEINNNKITNEAEIANLETFSENLKTSGN